MTELYIDDNRIILSSDTSTDLYLKNPSFTRQGEYTYDLDIDLRVKENALVYKHIDRLHATSVPSDRRAILIADTHVILTGTEVILSIEGYTAKIQIVSGYSELNYLASGDEKIRDFDFGSITEEITTTLARETLNYCYPQRNYCFTPVYKTYLDVAQTTDRNYFNEINRVAATPDAVGYVNSPNLLPQPYLLYYVEKVVELLGYTLDSNDLLNDARACRAISIHGVTSLKYNEMIPNWTINDFLTNIEQFFNVVFISDKITKKVRIASTNSYYVESNERVIDRSDVLGEIERTFSDEENTDVTDYTNISYEDAKSDEYLYYHISTEVLKLCTTIDVDSYATLVAMDLASLYNKLKIFHVVDIDTKFVIAYDDYFHQYYVKIVNQFEPIVGDDTSSSSLSLKIAPAEIYQLTNDFTLGNGGGAANHFVNFAPVPYARNQGTAAAEIAELLNQYIKEGIEDSELTGTLYVAIYAGILECSLPYISESEDYINKKAYYPVCINYPYFIYSGRWSGSDSLSWYISHLAEDKYTLSLSGSTGLNKSYYNGSNKIDTSIEYKIKFREKYIQLLNQLDIFIIDQKRFLCKELKLKVGSEGIDTIVEGTFYALY